MTPAITEPDTRLRRVISLRTKLALALAVVVVGFGAMMGQIVYSQQAHTEGRLRGDLDTVGARFRKGAIDALANDDIDRLQLLMSTAHFDEHVSRVWVLDDDGWIIADSIRLGRNPRGKLELANLAAGKIEEPIVVDGAEVITGAWPIAWGRTGHGAVVLEMSTADADAASAAVRRSALLAALVFLTMGGGAWIFVARITRRLKVLTTAATLTATTRLPGLLTELDKKGGQERSVKLDAIEVTSNDEIGLLTRSYNVMLETIANIGGRLGHLLNESEQRFSISFEKSPIGVAELHPSGVIVAANPALCALLGYSEDDLIGTELTEMASAEQREALKHALDRSRNGAASVRGEAGYVRSNNQVMWVHEGISVIPGDDDTTNLLVQMVDITEQRYARVELRRRSLHDNLTSLPNRELLENRLELALAHARRHGGQVATMFVDVDKFKLVNDNLGHTAGDQLLIELARRMSYSARETDTVARFGGDEFVVLCEHLTDSAQAREIAERLRADVAEPIDLGDRSMTVTLSIGIALSDGHDDSEALMRDADLAMYRAKQFGRDRVVVFEQAMRESLVEQLRLEDDLAECISRDQLRLHYQPFLNIRTGQTVGHEALVRWQHPTRGLLMPDQFLHAADQIGLLQAIDAFALETALAQLSYWEHEVPGADSWSIAVNSCPANFADLSYAQLVEDALARTGLAPGRLTIELTEDAVITESHTATQVVSRLRACGVSLAIDDFGTGYSSFSQLAALDFNVLKIDRSFIEKFQNESGAAIVKGVIDMAKALGLTTIAEGVELEADLETLRSMDADIAQGYLIARPMPAEEAIEAFLARSDRRELVPNQSD